MTIPDTACYITLLRLQSITGSGMQSIKSKIAQGKNKYECRVLEDNDSIQNPDRNPSFHVFVLPG